ncbi:MAG: VWA domain-containing protein [Thermoanaerobaculia bacterium]
MIPAAHRPRFGPSLAILAAITVLLSGVFAIREASPQQQADPSLGYQLEVSVDYILVPVVVRSPKGYLRDLEVDDFRLFVDDQPVPITSFERGVDAPISVIFLQDLSGSMANGLKIGLSRRTIHRFLAVRRPADLFALASFAHGRTEIEVPFTSDLERLHAAMDSWAPYGTTALHDAVSWLPEMTLEITSSKRAAVLISDGIDNASQIEAPDARERVRQAELPVYVMALTLGAVDETRSGNVELSGIAKDLDELAYSTGGKLFWIASQAAVDRACAVIFADLRQQYVLGFSTTATGPAAYRKIRVELRKSKRKHTLNYRRAYEGTPAEVAPSPSM